MERLHTSTIARALLRGIFGLALLLQAAGAALPAEAQTAHVAVTATLTGGAGALTIGSNVFAQSGASLSLTVTTNPATACVVVSIVQFAQQPSKLPHLSRRALEHHLGT